MSLDNSVSEYFKTVSAGRIPDEIKFYVKRSSKHSFPVSGDSKNTYNAEDWAGVKTPKVEPNSFKNVKLNDVGMRYMMNRRVFSVELDNKYIVEITEEFLFQALTHYGYNKKTGFGNKEFKFGIFNNSLKLYPNIKDISDKFKKLDANNKINNQKSLSRSAFIKQNKITTFVHGNIYKQLEPLSTTKYNDDEYIYIGQTKTGYHCFKLIYNHLQHNNIYVNYYNGLVFYKNPSAFVKCVVPPTNLLTTTITTLEADLKFMKNNNLTASDLKKFGESVLRDIDGNLHITLINRVKIMINKYLKYF